MSFENIKQTPIKHNLNDYNMLALAFVGDAVWSLFVREKLVRESLSRVNELHKNTTKFVKASAQSYVVEKLNLTEDELDVVRRGRNTKTNNKAKNSSEKDYKLATSFECLIGYLELTENIERLNLILNESYDIIKNEFMEQK